MKTFKIKTSDFINLKTINKITDKATLDSIAQVEKLTNDKIVRNLNKGKNSVLMIGTSGKYYITARPCYIDSLVNILESVGIESNDIIQLKKQTQVQDLTIDQLKNLLKA
jgi:predicted nucleotide-binding protein (sugar kinase/HSP70/actin superfamily)